MQPVPQPVPAPAAEVVEPTRALLRPMLVVLAFAIAWGVLRFAHGEINDDGMITFVYARNLLRGDGFVYNAGEWIYGCTVPLFGFFVTFGMALGFEPWTWVLGWDVVWGGVILWRLWQMLDAVGHGGWFPLLGFLLLWTSGLSLPVAGMETALYIALILSALARVTRGQPDAGSIAWATGAAALRPAEALRYE